MSEDEGEKAWQEAFDSFSEHSSTEAAQVAASICEVSHHLRDTNFLLERIADALERLAHNNE